MHPNPLRSALTPEDVRKVSPALERYTRSAIGEGLWKRPGLSPRDRGMVTVAALIARSQTIGMLHYFNLALDNGVEPGELSEIITHLAFYSGWSNAFAAVPIAKDIFEQRKIGLDQLPPESPELLPLNEAAEAERASRVQQDVGHVAPGVVQYTTDLLFRELWLRPALAPRDRSLVTVSALIASGQAAQVTYHLNRAMDNGLTKAEASEVLTHLAFYAGWPNVFSALPVVKAVFEKRPTSRNGKITMPHVIVKLWPGKSEQQKVLLAEKIASDVMDVLNYGEESVSVGFEEIKSQDWRDKVYKPDIQDKWEKLYKKPGCEM
jgi:4-carboxymuconolactone decarboxylase